MPSHEHEAIIKLLSDTPGEVPALAERLGLPLPPYATAETADSSLSQADPLEYRADLVVVLRDEERVPVQVVVVEMQRQIDEDKTWSWPVYLTVARARHRCPSALVVIATDLKTTEWARSMIARDFTHGWSLGVLGPDLLSKTEETSTLRQHPALAVISGLMHAKEVDAAPFLMRLRDLISDSFTTGGEAIYYWDVIEAATSELVRNLLGQPMVDLTGYEPKSEFSKALFKAMTEGRQKGLEQGLEEGREQGLEQGLEKGLEQGLEGLKRAFLAITRSRKLVLTPQQQTRIGSCLELSLLERWVARAAIASSAEEVFFSNES